MNGHAVVGVMINEALIAGRPDERDVERLAAVAPVGKPMPRYESRAPTATFPHPGVRNESPDHSGGVCRLRQDDPSVLFGAMAPDIQWNEAEGNPLADRNPYVGPQAIGEGVFGRLLAAIDGFSADSGSHRRRWSRGCGVWPLSRHDETQRRQPGCAVCHVWTFNGDRIVSFQQYTDTEEQWARLMP